MPFRAPRCHDLLDRFGDRRPDPRDLLQSFLLRELRERLAQVADRARRRAVGDGTEDVLALQLDEVGDLVQDLRDGVIADGERIEGHAPMLRRGLDQAPGLEAAGSRASSRYANADSRSPRARSFCAYSAASVDRSGWSSIDARISIARRYALSDDAYAPRAWCAAPLTRRASACCRTSPVSSSCCSAISARRSASAASPSSSVMRARSTSMTAPTRVSPAKAARSPQRSTVCRAAVMSPRSNCTVASDCSTDSSSAVSATRSNRLSARW